MFVDYYIILEINENATQEEVKFAFKKQALKWHPDRNTGLDTTKRMQEVNEAYLILKDIEARARYDKEYLRFKQFKNDQQQEQNHNHQQREREKSEQTYTYAEYQSEDEILNNWMKSAKHQSVDLAKQTIEDLKKIAKEGINGAKKGITNQIIGTIVFIIIISLIRTCKH